MNLVILTDENSYENGTKKLDQYLKEKNIDLVSSDVLFFPIDRKITISKEEIEKYESVEYVMMGKLTNTHYITREDTEAAFDIHDPFHWEDWEIGKNIACGYEQILNMIFSIISSKNKKILVIDHLEQNLHVLTTIYFLNNLLNNKNFTDIIITTYQPSILERFKEYTYKGIKL